MPVNGGEGACPIAWEEVCGSRNQKNIDKALVKNKCLYSKNILFKKKVLLVDLQGVALLNKEWLP